MRNVQLDNYRGLLIFSVVFGHLIETGLHQGEAIKATYFLIYLFHIPAFAAVSGYLSRSKIELLDIFRRVIFPYLIAEFFYRLFDFHFVGRGASFNAPYWLLWYFVSLACWKLVLPYWNKLPYPISTAVFLGIVAGFFDAIGHPFSLSRTLYFFPFFLLGHRISNQKFEEPQGNFDYLKVILFLIVICICVVVYTFEPDGYRILYGSQSYASLGYNEIKGASMRAVLYFTSFVMILAFFVISPKQESRLTVVGQRTLLIYVGHGFVVLALQKLGFGDSNHLIVSSLFVTLAICLIAVLLQRQVKE